MARPIYPPEHYASRFARVLALVERHLAAPLALPDLAREASFSPCHFHRLFCEWQGETPQTYIRRRRLEASANLLRYGPEPVREIAPRCGFTSVEAFTRAFRAWFGMTPGHWRRGGYARWREHGGAVRDLTQELSGAMVTVTRLPLERALYVRKIGPYHEGLAELWGRVGRVAAAFGLEGLPCFAVGLDDPDVTPPAHLRLDACVLLPRGVAVPPHTPTRPVGGGAYALLPYAGPLEGTESHWRWLVRHWLPGSRYRITEGHCFQRFPRGVPEGDGGASELCLPLRR
ncbi:MAG: AraC family transcriptional regulator [Telluria sp.]